MQDILQGASDHAPTLTESSVVQWVHADNAWLKRSESHHRAIKMSLVKQHCPALIKKYEQQQMDKADKKSQGGRKKTASKVSILAELCQCACQILTAVPILSAKPAPHYVK